MYKYHIVYKTTNIINNKIYVECNPTDDIDDGYIGSGFILKSAIRKYGRDKFKREVLYVFEERSEARVMEASIVDEDFVKRLDTYNLIEGGGGAGNQWGSKNHMYGKVGVGAKAVKATHKDGSVVIAESIQELADTLGIARGNIRNLIKKQIVGRKGWRVELCKDIV